MKQDFWWIRIFCTYTFTRTWSQKWTARLLCNSFRDDSFPSRINTKPLPRPPRAKVTHGYDICAAHDNASFSVATHRKLMQYRRVDLIYIYTYVLWKRNFIKIWYTNMNWNYVQVWCILEEKSVLYLSVFWLYVFVMYNIDSWTKKYSIVWSNNCCPSFIRLHGLFELKIMLNIFCMPCN